MVSFRKIFLLRPNFFYAIALSSVLVIFELAHRLGHDELENFISLSRAYVYLILIFALSFTNRGFCKSFTSIVGLVFFAQTSHYNYFGSFIHPFEIILFFTKNREVVEAIRGAIHLFIFPVLGGALLFFAIYQINRRFLHLKTSKIWTFVIVFFILFSLTKSLIDSKNHGLQLKGRPVSHRTYLTNSTKLIHYFISDTISQSIFDIKLAPPWRGNPLRVTLQAKSKRVKNIIFIIGESLASKYMHFYGNDNQNTPFLDSMRGHLNFESRIAIVAGTFTDSSIPMIINIAKKPNAIEHILSRKTNLFKLAKDHDYETSFVTVQSRYLLAHIKSQIGTEFIDYYLDPEVFDFGKEKGDSIKDENLLRALPELTKTGKNKFIILNMNGSHEVYKTRYPKNFNKFGDKTLVQHYHNSVLYTDYVLSKIKKYVDSINDNTVLVYTSDHGQHIGQEGFGKGNLEIESDWLSPFFIYANFDLDSKIKEYLNHSRYISHYEIGKVIAFLLGYDSLKNFSFESYVNGAILNGNAGYLKVITDRKQIIQKKLYTQ